MREGIELRSTPLQVNFTRIRTIQITVDLMELLLKQFLDRFVIGILVCEISVTVTLTYFPDEYPFIGE